MIGSDLYQMTGKLLLGYQMDQTLFYQLLATMQGKRELMRSWQILRSEDSTQTVYPNSGLTANSLYLTPFNLPDDFLTFYSPRRTIVLVSPDGVTFRWYDQITAERKHEYKDDDTKFYIDLANKKLYLCGLVDRQYSIHQFYIRNSPTVTAATSWIFPVQFHPILAFDVAQEYKLSFDYDVVNAEQGNMIARGSERIYNAMTEWDGSFQEQALSGVDYWGEGNKPTFYSRRVGDN